MFKEQAKRTEVYMERLITSIPDASLANAGGIAQIALFFALWTGSFRSGLKVKKQCNWYQHDGEGGIWIRAVPSDNSKILEEDPDK